jgi:hypothetical protein
MDNYFLFPDPMLTLGSAAEKTLAVSFLAVGEKLPAYLSGI